MQAPSECPHYPNDSLIRLTVSGEDAANAKIIRGEWQDADPDVEVHGWYFLIDAEGFNLHRTDAGDLWVSEMEIDRI